MKRLKILLLFLTLVSCRPEKKQCEFTSDNEELVIYNNILTDLIEKRMHYRYLGGKEDEIWAEYDYDKHMPDTVEIGTKITKAHNDIFNNPSKFCTIYLDTLSRPQFYYDSLRFEQDIEFKTLIGKYTKDPRAAVDSLNCLQQRYSPGEFGLCTATIDKIENWKSDSSCAFGRLRLSKIILNDTKDKGLVFYDWHCGSIGLCGHGGVIEFAKGIRRWEVIDFKYWNVY